MQKIIFTCPSCNDKLQISSLKCKNCGLELKGDFESSIFDRLDEDQHEFLISFLKCKGNIKILQEDLHISYPAAKKRLSQLLSTLNLSNDESQNNIAKESDMNKWNIKENNTLPSEIIRKKLKENGGYALVESINGNTYEIKASADGTSFFCDQLPVTPPYRYQVFDVIIELLVRNGGQAKKGMGRNAKLGEKNCETDTVVGAISKNYFGKNIGESVLDPVFVLSAVLDWAGIVYNRRGYLQLTDSYKSIINL